MHEWLTETAQALGICGSTVVMAAEGDDHRGKRHSVRFIELADQTLEIKIVMSADQATRLFELLEEEAVSLFYVKTEVEFNTVGAAQAIAQLR